MSIVSNADTIAKIEKAISDIASKGAPTEITINGDTLKITGVEDLLKIRDRLQQRENFKIQGSKGGIFQVEFDC